MFCTIVKNDDGHALVVAPHEMTEHDDGFMTPCLNDNYFSGPGWYGFSRDGARDLDQALLYEPGKYIVLVNDLASLQMFLFGLDCGESIWREKGRTRGPSAN